MGDGKLFAGLWEDWERDGEPIRSCTILTTEANDPMCEVHDRMPVILPPKSYATWLDPEQRDPAPLLPRFLPCRDDLPREPRRRQPLQR